jgi:tetratricopeptide (TPR) repeat protein
MEERIMFRIILSIMLAFLMACQPGPSQKDEKAIIAAIQDETDAYLHRDHARWAGHWLPAPRVSWTWITSANYYPISSWDSLNAQFRDTFKDTSVMEYHMDKYDFRVRNYGNVALVNFRQNQYIPGQSTPPDTVETLVSMEKHQGKWLIVDMHMVEKSSFSSTDQAVENTLNYLGYRLIGAKRFKKAVAVLKLNVDMFPGSWNVYDTLGEAYMKSGQKAPAIQNYEKSLKLNPKNKNAEEMLKKLRGK